MLVIVAGILLVGVILLLAYPFWRGAQLSMPSDPETASDQERINLEIEKQTLLASLADLEVERTQGRLAPVDYERLKARDEHRLVKILDRIQQRGSAVSARPHGAEAGSTGGIRAPKKAPLPAPAPRRAARKQTGGGRRPAVGVWVTPAVLGLLVVGTASGIYTYMDRQIGLEAQKRAQNEQRPPQGMPNPIEMVARLEKRLRENPDDLQGQMMAGRSYMELGRLDDARRAWGKVLELDKRSHEAHLNLGIILLQGNPTSNSVEPKASNTVEPKASNTTDPKIFEAALAHFDAALINVPRDPVVLWYKGVALVHLRRYSEADATWTTAYQNLAPGSEDAEFVKQALQSLRAGNVPLS